MEKLIIGEDVKRFKVENIEKYEGMIDEIEQEIANTRFSIGCNILFCSISLLFVVLSFKNSNYFGAIWNGIITLVGGVFLDERLYKLFDLFNEKRCCKNDINMLQDELELNDEFQKTKRK